MTVSDDPVPPPEEASDSPARPEDGLSEDLEHWTLPEDFVLDEEFVRAGVHEPPARTRIAIARHDAELARQAEARVRPAAPRVGRSAQVDWPEETTVETPPARKHPRWRRVVAVLLAFGLLCATVLGRFLPANAVGVYAAGARLTNAPGSTITGISATAAAGTCYSIGTQSSTEVDLQDVPCAQPHSYELAGHTTAADFPTYPDDDYWATYVSPTCYQAVTSYLGKPRDQWPVGVRAAFFRPSAATWKDGDRSVSCITALPPTGVANAPGS